MEFALVAPVLTIMVLGLANYVLGFSSLIQLRNAVEAGASYCMHNGAAACTSSQVASTVAHSTTLAVPAGNVGLNLSYGCATATGVTLQSQATPNCASGIGPGQYAIVSANYTYVSSIGQVSIPLSSQTLIRLQ